MDSWIAATSSAAARFPFDRRRAYPDPRNGLGVLLVQDGRPREALVHFDAALQLVSDFHEARLNRAIALHTAGDRAAAIQEIEWLLQKLPLGPAHL